MGDPAMLPIGAIPISYCAARWNRLLSRQRMALVTRRRSCRGGARVFALLINGVSHQIDVPADIPLL
jgi:hypothetical protein